MYDKGLHLTFLMSLSLLYPRPYGTDVSVKSLSLLSYPPHTLEVLTLKLSIKEFRPHAHTHHVVIVVIIAMLTLCYLIMLHAILSLYFHTSRLTLQTSLLSHALC
jgi:hypothetical protein